MTRPSFPRLIRLVSCSVLASGFIVILALVAASESARGPLAIIVVLALVVAGLGYMFLGRGGGASSPAFALDLSAGQTYTYQMTLAMNAQASVNGRTVPVQEQMGATMKWDVQSVDAQGIATVSVDLSNFAAKVNGRSVPTASISKKDTHFTMRIAKDGTILSGGGLGMLGGSNAATSNLPGADQLTPLLPGHNVQPGATWTKSYRQTLPYGMGTVHAKTHSTYLRNEDVNGTSAAVIVTTMTMPLHLRINLRDMMRKLGSSTGGLPAGANPVMTYGGKITGQTTGWFDPVARQMLKSSMTAQFAMRIGITGVPGSALGGMDHLGLSGTMTMTLQRV